MDELRELQLRVHELEDSLAYANRVIKSLEAERRNVVNVLKSIEDIASGNYLTKD